jgi:peptide/nickel transport system substrate-binding protein
VVCFGFTQLTVNAFIIPLRTVKLQKEIVFMKKSIFALVLAVAISVSLLAACGSTDTPSAATSPTPPAASPAADAPDADAPVYGGILKVALNRTVSAKSLDPLYIDSTTADQIEQNFGDTMVHQNADGSEFIPNIATAWDISEDGKTYTFTVREDVYFHPGKYQDGRLMTSEDVAYSINRAKDYWCNYLFFLDYAEATDSKTVVCHLLDPNATFLYELTSSSTIMVPKEDVEGWGEDFGMHPVGTGPFMVEEHAPDQYTKLVKAPNYWGVEPYLDGITYYTITDEAQTLNALTTGEVDISLTVSGEAISQVAANDKLTLAQGPENRISYLGFNTSNDILSNDDVRKALIMAVDAKGLAEGVYSNGDGSPSSLPVPKTSWGYDESLESLVPAYNPEGAKALLAEAGYPNGFSVVLTVGTGEVFVRAATAIQQYLAQIGVDVEIQSLSATEITARFLDNTVQLWITGQGGSSDPATFIGYFLNTEKLRTNYNAFAYSKPETDAIIKSALIETNQNARRALYIDLIKEALNTHIGVFYATSNLSWGISDKVHGYVQEERAVMRVCGNEGSGINIWLAN